MTAGCCRDAGIKYWHKKPTDHSPAAFEAMVRRGNAMLKSFANEHGIGYLDRAGTMESIPKVDDSPCISHHPYGLLSETHVQMVLNALAERT